MGTADEIYVRDLIFPLVEIESASRMVDACGTCFLIGSRGFALTAAHVLDQMKPEMARALFVHEGQWQAADIVSQDTHPVQDVAVIKLASERLKVQQPIVHVSGQRRQSSCQVEAWGYPRRVTLEPQREGQEVSFRPDLIYFSGYVRRRIPRELPMSIYRGNSFYELSFVAGEACSGGPLVVRRDEHWDVAGIYVGESTSTAHFAVGYAATADSFFDWTPETVGRSIRDEASAAS